MKKSLIASVIATGLMLLGATAQAQTKAPAAPAPAAAAQATQKIPAALQLAVQGGLKVERSFQAEGNMTGWILSEGPGRNMVVYTSADGQIAIAGNMLDTKGQNLTAKYLEQYGPKADLTKFWPKLEQSSFVAEGAKGKDVKNVIYVFKDANCGYCHMMWQALQPYTKAGLQVRWIPVAFLGADSRNKAAALLGSKDQQAVINTLHAEWGKTSSLATTPVTAELNTKIEANGRLMGELGFRGTPATIYKDKAGKVLSADGMPRPATLQALTGITLPTDAK